MSKLVQLLFEDHEKHRCMNGKLASFGSSKCILDIEKRIDDATDHRDQCSARTDARLHYNGLLRILRRNLRSALKSNGA